MEILKFNVGDTVWLAVGKKSLAEGQVIAVLTDLPGWNRPQYVVEIQTPMDPYLEIRDGLTLSDAPDKPIGMWRQVAK